MFVLDSKARTALSGLSRWTGSLVSRLGVSANVVTVAGAGITAVAAWLVVARRPVAAGIVLLVAGCFDFIDGAVARATGKTSRFGALLDSVTDRLSDGMILGSLSWVMLARADRQGVLLALGSLVVVNLVSYVKAKAESLGYECKVGFMERAERIFVLVVGLVFDIVVPVLGILLLASLFTLAQRLVHVARQRA